MTLGIVITAIIMVLGMVNFAVALGMRRYI